MDAIKELQQEYIDKISNITKEYEDKVKELEEKKKELNNIKMGQKFFYISSDGSIYETFYQGIIFDKRLYRIGNCFPFTKENRNEVYKEVESIVKRQLLQADLRRFAKENNTEEIDWNNCNQSKYFININTTTQEMEAFWYNFSQRVGDIVYFTSQEICEKAIEKFGDRIKELYLQGDK